MSEDLLIDIPEEFRSATTGGFYEHCIECDKYLLDEGTPYLIEKVMKNYVGYKAQDTIVDYAICMDCAQKMHQKMSKESLAATQQFFKERVDIDAQVNLDMSDTDDSLGFTNKCLVRKKTKDECSEYQVYAFCRGNQMSLETPPYMICGEAMEELMELLSDSTKDELGGFFDRHFAPDPTLFEGAPNKRLIWV